MDQINESVQIIIQYDNRHQPNDNIQMIKLPQLDLHSTLPVYSIKQQDISNVRNYFYSKNWVLLPSFATMNTMYLCDSMEYKRKLSTFITQTKSYALIKEFNISNGDNFLKYCLDQIFTRIKSQLRDLLNRHCITMEQYQQIIGDEHQQLEFNSLFFRPDTRLENVPIRPLIIGASGPLNNIAQFLYSFLQSSYCLATHATTFQTGADAVQAIELYTKNGFLHSSTVFVTLEFNNFESIFNHEEVLGTLERFLHQYVSRRQTQGLSFETIMILARLYLKMQIVKCHNTLYAQKKGGSIQSSLIQLLINIYLFYRQQELIKYLFKRKEVFGRNFTKSFFSWNGSKRKLSTILNIMKNKHTCLSFHQSIGSSIHFLDIKISHNHGKLRTNIFRSYLMEPYTTSYQNNYPSEEYTKMIRRILIRAALCCNNVNDFYIEYKNVYYGCLLNRFPMDFITKCTRQFFTEFNPSKSNLQYSQQAYENLRLLVINNSSLVRISGNGKRLWQNDNINDNIANINCQQIKRLKISSNN